MSKNAGNELPSNLHSAIDSARPSGFGQLDAVTKIMNVGVLLLSSSFDLEFANGLACELLEFHSEDEFKDDWPRMRPLLQLDELGALSKPRALKVDFNGRDGLRFLRLEAYALDKNCCAGYLVLIRDRRMVHVLENDLLLASQMRAQNYLYGALIHDLRAPLNAMQITVELLSNSAGHDGRYPDSQSEREDLAPERYIAVLREELARLNRTLRTVLDYGAPLNPTLKDFDLVAVVGEIVTLLTPQAKRQHVDLQSHLPQQPVLICGQRDRIKQALLNVAINGLEALPKSGGFLRIDVLAGESRAEIIFTDSGPGVPEDLLDTIYQVYFTTKKAGSGLGLYVARLVLESHGGDIRVESAPDSGARFCLSLPRA